MEKNPFLIQKKKGDLLKLFEQNEFDVIVHGCNCFHTMGAGIAGQIAEKYPQAVWRDLETGYCDGKKLGNWSAAFLLNGQIIINLYTQYGPGRQLNHWALYLGFEKLLRYFVPIGKRIGIPAIGAGIGGGNWDEIYPVLSEIAITTGHGNFTTYVEYEPEEVELLEEETKHGTD